MNVNEINLVLNITYCQYIAFNKKESHKTLVTLGNTERKTKINRLKHKMENYLAV